MQSDGKQFYKCHTKMKKSCANMSAVGNRVRLCRFAEYDHTQKCRNHWLKQNDVGRFQKNCFHCQKEWMIPGHGAFFDKLNLILSKYKYELTTPKNVKNSFKSPLKCWPICYNTKRPYILPELTLLIKIVKLLQPLGTALNRNCEIFKGSTISWYCHLATS